MQAFVNFKSLVELQLNCKIKAVQSDWGGEYRSLSAYLTTHGIVHRRSCPHLHEQNGLAKRKHAHITEVDISIFTNALLG